VWTKEYQGIFEYHEIHSALDATKVAEPTLEKGSLKAGIIKYNSC